MNRTLVLAEWRLARNALRAAQLLARHGIYADAVSRAYYAVPHAAKAALQTKDISAESHAAVKRLFGLHFVKTEEFEPGACLRTPCAWDLRRREPLRRRRRCKREA